jgi:hypothetical protein
MENRDYSGRGWLLLFAVVLGVAALSFIPSTKVFGLTTEEVDILADLRPFDQDAAAAVPVDYEADFELLESELAAIEAETDSLELIAPSSLRWIAVEDVAPERKLLLSEDIKFTKSSQFVPIEDYDTAQVTRFDRFIDKLIDGSDVRVAFLGDSFIEGDIITVDLREKLQSIFGGRGVGFVPCAIPFEIYRTSVRRNVSGWTAYSLMNTGTIPASYRDKFFMSGYLASGSRGSVARWSVTDAKPHLDSCTRARVLITSRDTSNIELVINDTLTHHFGITGADYVRELYVEAPVQSLKMKVLSGNVLCHGASLEGGRGVIIDNMSIRGNSGYTIFGSGVAVNRQVDKLWGYDLVVLEYGLNGMQPGQRDYSRYQGKLEDMIAYVKRSFPDAAILILGVSDRWIKGDGGWRSMNSVEIMTPFQRRASQNEGVAFWEMGKVILSYGGIGGFVRNGWAAGDYIHINFKGGARIAEPLSEAIRQRAYERLVEREGKIRDLVYPLEISPKEIFPLRREVEIKIVDTPLMLNHIEE